MWLIAFICILPTIIDGKLGSGDQKEIGSKTDKLLVSLTLSIICFKFNFIT